MRQFVLSGPQWTRPTSYTSLSYTRRQTFADETADRRPALRLPPDVPQNTPAALSNSHRSQNEATTRHVANRSSPAAAVPTDPHNNEPSPVDPRPRKSSGQITQTLDDVCCCPLKKVFVIIHPYPLDFVTSVLAKASYHMRYNPLTQDVPPLARPTRKFRKGQPLVIPRVNLLAQGQAQLKKSRYPESNQGPLYLFLPLVISSSTQQKKNPMPQQTHTVPRTNSSRLRTRLQLGQQSATRKRST